MNKSFRVGDILKATNSVTILNIGKRVKVIKTYYSQGILKMDLEPIDRFYTIKGDNWSCQSFIHWTNKVDSGWDRDIDHSIKKTINEVLSEA